MQKTNNGKANNKNVVLNIFAVRRPFVSKKSL
jgi:hypothetical protein